MTENILTTLKIIPLVIIAVLLIPSINVDNFVPQTSGHCHGFPRNDHYCVLAVYRF